jgi:folate-binding protein YgfZ
MSAIPRAEAAPGMFSDATCAWADLGPRTIVTALGPDAARFIESFTTASVIGLEPGQGTETMFTDARGWVIALAAALRVDDGLMIVAEPGLGGRLREHLEHYHIRERVELVDASAEHAGVLLAGPRAADWLTTHGAPLPQRLFGHVTARLDDVPVRIICHDWWTAAGWLVLCAAADRARLVAALQSRFGPPADPAAVDASRILRGTPCPADVREKTLPQELGRDARAISFTKGCYLGQETVARLDAVGHVNRRLAVVQVAAAVRPGAEIRHGGEACGLLTSVAPHRSGPGMVGLAWLPTRIADDAVLSVDGIEARQWRRA